MVTQTAAACVAGVFLAAWLDSSPAADTVIAVAGAQFTIDRSDGRGPQRKLLLLISYFDGLHAAGLDEDLDYVAGTLHFDGIRVLPNWESRAESYCPQGTGDGLFDAAGRVRGDTTPVSGPLARLLSLIAAAGKRGLIVDVSFTRETVAGLGVADYVRAVTRAATLLRPYRNVLFDLQNEIDKNLLPEAEAIRLRQAIGAIDPSRVIVASRGGAAKDVAAYNQRLGADAIAYHDPRVPEWAEQTAAAVAPLLASARPVYLQEPQAWNSGFTICNRVEGKTLDADGTAAHFQAAVAGARGAGVAAWTFHTRQGFRLNGGGTLRSRIQANAAERTLLEGTANSPSLAAIANGR